MTYQSIRQPSEGHYTEKRSRFLSFALPVHSIEEVKCRLLEYRKKYFDAHHVCWAYVLGATRSIYRANDDGEPSSTAGKPILGQINASQLTDILIIVVRYFGGIELGTSGLIIAYRTAAKAAIDAAEIVERTEEESLTVVFEYPYLNSIMRIIKEEQLEIESKAIEMKCEITLRIPTSLIEQVKGRFLKVETTCLKT